MQAENKIKDIIKSFVIQITQGYAAIRQVKHIY